jgi:segregation and condensation protein B
VSGWYLSVEAAPLTFSCACWVKTLHRFAGQALSRSGKPARTAAAQLSGARPAGANRRLRPNVPLGMEAAGKKSGAWRRCLDARGPQIAAVPDPHARDAGTARLEAVLFLAREPINTRKLAQLAHLADGTEARTLIRRLNRWYDETGSAFVAEELAGGFQLLSRPQFGGWLRRLYGGPADIRLSAPALETLAVVAYRQPVMRSEIEAIRGVDCGEILRQLMDRNLVRAAGRAEELGRPYLYATTKRFLQVFGLKHLDDLPRAALLRPNPESAAPAGASTSANPSRPREIHES